MSDEPKFSEIKVELQHMYNAGRNLLPNYANAISDSASQLEKHTRVMHKENAVSDGAPGLYDIVYLSDTIYQNLRQAVITLNDGAVGLVRAADELLEVETSTQKAFDHLRHRLIQSGSPSTAVTGPVPPAAVPKAHPGWVADGDS